MRIHALAFLLLSTVASGQPNPLRSAWMTWPDLKVVITPDTGETLLWLTADSTMARESGGRVFYGAFDPSEAIAWVGNARAFLNRRLTDRDTGAVRTSPVLRARAGEQMYFVRRRYEGRWTHERFLVFSDSAGRTPALIEADVRFPHWLDSLAAVARRTPRRR